MYIVICKYCGKEKEYKYKGRAGKYCSHECYIKDIKGREYGERTTLICKTCGEKFTLLNCEIKERENRGFKVQYCSRRCSGLDKRKRKEVACKECGKNFETRVNVFCSAKCMYENRKKTGILKKNGYWFENGYKVIYLEDNNSIKEHIRIMEEHIGRKLYEDEVVHHINQERADNRLKNLRLMTRGEHSSLHRKLELENGKELFGR